MTRVTSQLPRLRFLLAALVSVLTVPAQLPPDEKLAPADLNGMTEEVDHFSNLFSSANDKCSVAFEIARDYSAGRQYRQAIEWLGKTVDAHCGFDPSRDRWFALLAQTREVRSLINRSLESAPPVSNSRDVATIPEADLFPENIAYDPSTKSFLLGSTVKDEILRCGPGAACKRLVYPKQGGLGDVLGMKIDPSAKTLWATSNTDQGSSLRQYSLDSGRLLGSYPLAGPHLLNDVAISLTGDVFVTDTRGGAVYGLSRAHGALERLAPKHEFTAANGIAVSGDGKMLFVSTFGDGITILDLATKSTTPMSHPPGICLAYIDGLYAYKGSLIAIQNGPMIPRIVRFSLDRRATRITAVEILERRNPLFDGLTTGALVADRFYYAANNQLDKAPGGKDKGDVRLDPIRIMAITLRLH